MTLLSVKLVQPGRLGDVAEGFARLAPSHQMPEDAKKLIRKELASLIENGRVCLYAGNRYMLTSDGESVVEATGIREKIEARRLFLLKETRKNTLRARSDTRE